MKCQKSNQSVHSFQIRAEIVTQPIHPRMQSSWCSHGNVTLTVPLKQRFSNNLFNNIIVFVLQEVGKVSDSSKHFIFK